MCTLFTVLGFGRRLQQSETGHAGRQPCQRLPAGTSDADEQSVAAGNAKDATDARQMFQNVPSSINKKVLLYLDLEFQLIGIRLELLENDEIQARFVRVVEIDNVTLHGLIQTGHVRHFTILPVLVQQIGHRVVAEQQVVQRLDRNLQLEM